MENAWQFDEQKANMPQQAWLLEIDLLELYKIVCNEWSAKWNVYFDAFCIVLWWTY
jgi:hypothetical protein